MIRQSVLEIQNLTVEYQHSKGSIMALNNVSLKLYPREVIGVVGESGCGKSTLAYAVMNYLGQHAKISGSIQFQGQNLLAKSDREMDKFRGSQIALVNQNPFTSLNPSVLLGRQLAEVAVFHRKISWKAATALAYDMLQSLNIPDAKNVMKRYPHEISGGMQQRFCIAMGLICNPSVLIMDEPTTALDVTTEVVILDLVRDLAKKLDTAIIYISHDLGIISSISDRIAVMYRGELAELASKEDLFNNPQHPYTEALINCIPKHRVTKNDKRLATIPGYISSRTKNDSECAFKERCKYSGSEGCAARGTMFEVSPGHWTTCIHVKDTSPEFPASSGLRSQTKKQDKDHLLEVKNLSKTYFTRRNEYRAVDNISFFLNRNSVIGIVGESGCGKSTTALCIAGLQKITNGDLKYKETSINCTWQHRRKDTLKEIQMVFQDPARSLNPIYTVEQIIGRPLKTLCGIRSKQEQRRVITELLSKVGLSEQYLKKKTGQMSGGERQRIAVARVFAVKPDLIICDEPTSALDVSVQAAVLNLLLELQQNSDNLSYIFISHDLHVVNYISDYVIVMYLGKICEAGKTAEIFNPPYHPYTEALLSAVPEIGLGEKKTLIRLEGSVPVPDGRLRGCPFHTRCPRKIGSICETTVPPEIHFSSTHNICCHLSIEELNKMNSVI